MVVNYLNKVWRQCDRALAELVEQVRALIRRERLLVAFTWVPRQDNQLADAAGRWARDRQADVHYANEPCDWLLEKYYPRSTTKDMARAIDKEEDQPEPDLTLLPVRVRRPRGRPPKIAPPRP